MLSIDTNSRLRAYCSPTSKEASRTTLPEDRHEQNAEIIIYSPIALVLSTPELLELILLHLDLQTLLLATRTSKIFQALITSSPRLRQNLWLDINPSISSTSAPIINPLLERVITSGKHSYIRFLELDQPATLGLYPSLSRRLRPSDPPTVCVALQPSARKQEWKGSWRGMYVVQPFSESTRWDAYLFRWATREWDFRYTTTFDDGTPRAGRVVGFALGPGGEEGKF